MGLGLFLILGIGLLFLLSRRKSDTLNLPVTLVGPNLEVIRTRQDIPRGQILID